MIRLLNKLLIFLILFNILSGQSPAKSGDYDKYLFFHWKGALTSHSIIIKTFPQLDKLQASNFNTFLVLYRYLDNNQTQVDKIVDITFQDTLHPVTETLIDSLESSTNYKYAYLFSTEASVDEEAFTSLLTQNKVS